MRFRIEDHDVTCLCALANLPPRVIVEELAPRGARARFRVQAFVERDVGELLEWMEPALRGARVERAAGDSAFVSIEIEEGAGVEFLRQELRALAGWLGPGLRTTIWIEEEHADPVARLGRLAGAMA
jgi:hypothetical protein